MHVTTITYDLIQLYVSHIVHNTFDRHLKAFTEILAFNNNGPLLRNVTFLLLHLQMKQ